MAAIKSFVVYFVLAAAAIIQINAQLTPNFYEKMCPQALPTIRTVVRNAITNETRMGASLLRLHFHDCFVNGCDGSLLLDDTANFVGEKTAIPNNNSVRGFDVIDEIKQAVNTACKGNVVSCADIVAVAARDSVNLLGGPYYPVQLGRRDARTASFNDANANLPSPFSNFSVLLSSFQSQGLNLQDLVALSGGHSIGLARCPSFRNRIYNDSDIDPVFAASKRNNCPVTGGTFNTEPLDATTTLFDNRYFKDLIVSRGLLHSDQQLFKNDSSDSDRLVRKYSTNPISFASDFSASMIKMGNLNVLAGNEGEIRMNCRRVN
ncbi:hypothetical protein WN944_022942 [Citrus x changshan-huyou]